MDQPLQEILVLPGFLQLRIDLWDLVDRLGQPGLVNPLDQGLLTDRGFQQGQGILFHPVAHFDRFALEVLELPTVPCLHQDHYCPADH